MAFSALTLLQIAELAAVAVFAVTGALAASRKDMDIFGYIVLGVVTGIGGGSIRDVVLGRLPLFWIVDLSYLLVCSLAAAAVYFAHHLLASRMRALLWLDAVGLSMFCVTGAILGMKAGVPPAGAVVLGVVTATFGGLLRDILAGEIPLILRKEIYVTAALLGSGLYVGAVESGLAFEWAAGIASAACFILRGLAIHYGWHVPRLDRSDGESGGDRSI